MAHGSGARRRPVACTWICFLALGRNPPAQLPSQRRQLAALWQSAAWVSAGAEAKKYQGGLHTSLADRPLACHCTGATRDRPAFATSASVAPARFPAATASVRGSTAPDYEQTRQRSKLSPRLRPCTGLTSSVALPRVHAHDLCVPVLHSVAPFTSPSSPPPSVSPRPPALGGLPEPQSR